MNPAAGQALLNELFPVFMTIDPEDVEPGSRWTAIADLTLQPSDDGDRPWYLVDLAPPISGEASRVLPRGSTIRFLEPYTEVWGVGYIAGVWLDFSVEDGPLRGATITVGTHFGRAWEGGAARRTLAVALIVAAGDPIAHDLVLAREHYDRVTSALLDIEPIMWRSERHPSQLITTATDLAALARAGDMRRGS